jgi:hypothetical protein
MESFGGEPIGETSGNTLDFVLDFLSASWLEELGSGKGLLIREDVGMISHSAVASSRVGLVEVDKGEDLKMEEVDP